MNSTILIIEDDLSFSSLLVNKLKKEFDLITKENGMEAFLWIKSSSLPDLIIADLNMPQMDGFELIAKLKSDPKFSKIPLIIVSGEEDALIKNNSYKAGANKFFTKPINLNELDFAVKELINRNLNRKKAYPLQSNTKKAE